MKNKIIENWHKDKNTTLSKEKNNIKSNIWNILNNNKKEMDIDNKIKKIEDILKNKDEIEMIDLKWNRQIFKNWEQVLNTLLNQIWLNNPKYTWYYSSKIVKKLLRKWYNLEEIYIYLNKEIKINWWKTIFEIEKDFKEKIIEEELILNKDIWEIEKVCWIYIKKLFWINSYFGIKKEIEIEEEIKSNWIDVKFLTWEQDNKLSIDLVLCKEKFLCWLQIKPISFLNWVKYWYWNYNKQAYFKNLSWFNNSKLNPIYFLIYDKKNNVKLYDTNLTDLNISLQEFIKLIKKEDILTNINLEDKIKEISNNKTI